MIDSVSAFPAGLDTAGIGADFRLPPTAGAASAAPPQVSFGDVLAQVSGNAVETLRAAETTSISGLRGQASVLEVVEAVKAAEQSLQTAISIRDKVVAAYQEISRMAI